MIVFQLHFAQSALGVRYVPRIASSLNITAGMWKNCIMNISVICVIRGHALGIWVL
jgi:hypothetical protein